MTAPPKIAPAPVEPLGVRATRLVWYQTDRHCPMCHWPRELFCGPHCAAPDWPYARAEYWAEP